MVSLSSVRSVTRNIITKNPAYFTVRKCIASYSLNSTSRRDFRVISVQSFLFSWLPLPCSHWYVGSILKLLSPWWYHDCHSSWLHVCTSWHRSSQSYLLEATFPRSPEKTFSCELVNQLRLHAHSFSKPCDLGSFLSHWIQEWISEPVKGRDPHPWELEIVLTILETLRVGMMICEKLISLRMRKFKWVMSR